MKTVCYISLFIFLFQTAKGQTKEFNDVWLLGYSLFDSPKKIKEQLKTDTNLFIISVKDIPRNNAMNDTLYLCFGRQLNPVLLNTYRLDSLIIGLTGGRSWKNQGTKYAGKTKCLEIEYFMRDKDIIENLYKKIIKDCKKGTNKSSRHKLKMVPVRKETSVFEFEYADSIHGICYIWIWISFNYETLSYSLKIQEISSEN